jgi:hypothetical protein
MRRFTYVATCACGLRAENLYRRHAVLDAEDHERATGHRDVHIVRHLDGSPYPSLGDRDADEANR